MQMYEVGKKCFPATRGNSVHFQASDDGLTLLVAFDRPTAKEKGALKKVPQIKFTVVNDIIFILARFGTEPWIDAPFYSKFSGLTAPIQMPSDTQGLALHYMLVDSSTGVLLHQRLIGLEHDLSYRLAKAINEQPEIPNYDAVLNVLYNQYSTVQLVEKAKEQDNEK